MYSIARPLKSHAAGTSGRYWYYTIEIAAVLPGGQRQYASGYSSYRGMSGYGGNTQIHNILVAIAGHAAG
jgi:hypothetical protein